MSCRHIEGLPGKASSSVCQSALHSVQPEYRNNTLYSLDLAVRQDSSQKNHQNGKESAKLDMANKLMALLARLLLKEHVKLALTEKRFGNCPQL